MLGYAIGHFLWMTPAGDPTAVANFFFENVFSAESFDNVGAMYDKYNFWIVFTAGFTPLPYKLFTIAGGMFDINFTMFLIASTISRGMRFFLIGWLIWRYGQPIKVFIDKYFNLLATLFTVLLIGFFALAVSIFDGDGEQSAESIETNTEVITE
jgi:membrane protein DedA with SNARE-associated domain